jgi:hypothetical protein
MEETLIMGNRNVARVYRILAGREEACQREQKWSRRGLCEGMEGQESITVNAMVATVLGAIPAFSDTVESEERLMK